MTDSPNDTLLQKGKEKRQRQLDRKVKWLTFKYRNTLRKSLKKGKSDKEVDFFPVIHNYTDTELVYMADNIAQNLTQNPKNSGWEYFVGLFGGVSFVYTGK